MDSSDHCFRVFLIGVERTGGQDFDLGRPRFLLRLDNMSVYSEQKNKHTCKKDSICHFIMLYTFD